MVTFDGGRLCANIEFLALQTIVRMFPGADAMPFGNALTAENRAAFIDILKKTIAYCKEMAFPMTRIPLERVLSVLTNEAIPIGLTDVSQQFYDALQRLHDEAATCLFLRVLSERTRFYTNPQDGWEKVVARFPSSVSDIEEANICYALERHAACVFHCVLAIESSLIALGEFIGVEDPKSGWTAVANRLEKIVQTKYTELTPFEAANFGFLTQVQSSVTALKNAWRNKISHAHGRLAVMTADFQGEVAAEILMASRGFMRTLATGLPPVAI